MSFRRLAVVSNASLALILMLAGCTGQATTLRSTSPSISTPTGTTSLRPTATGTSAPSSSPPSSATAQSKAEACALLATALSTIGTSLQTAYTTLQSNPTKAVTQLESAAAAFSQSTASVTDPRGAALATETESDLAKLVDDTKQVLSNSSASTDAATKQATAVESDLTAVGSYCK